MYLRLRLVSVGSREWSKVVAERDPFFGNKTRRCGRLDENVSMWCDETPTISFSESLSNLREEVEGGAIVGFRDAVEPPTLGEPSLRKGAYCTAEGTDMIFTFCMTQSIRFHL